MNYSEETTNRILSAIQNYRSTAESLLLKMNDVFYSCVNESMQGETAEALQQYYLAHVLPKISDELIDDGESSFVKQLEHMVRSIDNAFIQTDYVMSENIRCSTDQGELRFERIEVDDYVKSAL